MSSANKRMAEQPMAREVEYVAPALIVLGRVSELTEFNFFHHHHHGHHHRWDGAHGLHPPGLPPALFNGSA